MVKKKYLLKNAKVGNINGNILLIFDERYFSQTRLIKGPSGIPIRIIDKPLKNSDNDWVFKCRLFTNDMSLYLPASDLTPGTEYQKDWSLKEK